MSQEKTLLDTQRQQHKHSPVNQIKYKMNAMP